MKAFLGPDGKLLPTPSTKERVLLRQLVRLGEQTRLELVARSGRVVSTANAYTTLERLQAKGLVASRLVERPGLGPQGRLYRATALGAKVVKVLSSM